MGVVGRGGGGDKKKEGKKRESEGKEGEREGAQRMHFKVSPAIGWGGSWAQCEIIEVKGGSPSLVRKS